MLEKCLSDAGVGPTKWAAAFWGEEGTRRRATLSYRRTADTAIIGFLGRQTHFILAIDACLILHPALKATLPLQDWALIALQKGDTGRIQINMLDEGADITLLPDTEMSAENQTMLASAAAQTDLLAAMVRLSIQQPDSQIATPLLAPKAHACPALACQPCSPRPPFYRLARQARPQ